jgi:HAD superfamily hydrolase (TIGR01509 family)
MFNSAIFDWDGTLADTRKVILVSFQKALFEVGLKVTDEFVERRIGIGAAETFREILRSTNTTFGEGLVERLVGRKIELEIDLADRVELFEGARGLLEELQGKVKVGLASMNNEAVISYMLRQMDLEKYFGAVLTAESIVRSKPDPEIFLKTAKRLNSHPEQCVVFEDSIFGVKAAKAAGMGCIAVTTGVYSKEELEFEKPSLTVKTLRDLRIVPFILL